VPLAGDIAQTSARLLFSRAPAITARDAANQAALEALMDDGTHAKLLEAGELCSALGGVFLRVVWDTDVSDHPFLDAVPADAAVPHFSYGKLQAVTFWRVISDDGSEVVRHMETHVPGANSIMHGVYVGDQTDLGRIYPLSDFPETAQFAQYLTDGDAITFPDQPKDASTCVYVPNMRPNRIWRDLGPQAAPLGRSDYQGIETELDALDETMTSWMRDVQLAKARLIVPQTYLDNIGRGKGAVFDPDRQVYSPINYLTSGTEGPSITVNQFAVRWQDFSKTCAHWTAVAVRGAGYSSQTFASDDTGVAMTATEIEARERQSLITRDIKILHWRPALRDILYGWLSVEREIFRNQAVTPERPSADFAEEVLPDKQALAQTAQLMRAAEAASTQVLVQMLHPDWTQDQVDAETSRIRDEIGLELIGRARITLSGAPDEPLAQQLDDIATPLRIPPVPPGVPGVPLDQGGQ